MNSEHTPGPWVVAKERNKWDEPIVIPAGDYDLRADGYLAVVHEDKNAALIAAAPELLAALRVLTDECNHHPDQNCAHRRAASALLARVDGGGK